MYDHAVRAIDKALARLSPRGLPLMGEADWNDGLNGAGIGGKGESVWMGHFLYGILRDWAGTIDRAVAQKAIPAGEKARAARYRKAAEKLKNAVNRHGWDGAWYKGATTDDGAPLGSHLNKEGKIYLNCQTWAILNDVVPSEARRNAVLRSLEKHLYGPHGPLLLTPAYTVPDERVGYLTRYSPTTRENGGVYFHAAVWALQMECSLGRARKAWELYQRMSPVVRGAKEPDLYRAEPYVTPGNVDGPGSPTPGRAGWTWYTGSAAWLYRISTEWFLGIRPEWEGLRVRPCLPPPWNEAEATRVFRGGTYRITIRRDPKLPAGGQKNPFQRQGTDGGHPACRAGKNERCPGARGAGAINGGNGSARPRNGAPPRRGRLRGCRRPRPGNLPDARRGTPRPHLPWPENTVRKNRGSGARRGRGDIVPRRAGR
jgi:cellobiose phosphorylase